MSCVERLQITGGVRLTGSVRINGAKNAILPLLAGSLLSEKSVVLEGVPSLIDVKTMKEALESLGVRVNWRGDTMQIDPRVSVPRGASYFGKAYASLQFGDGSPIGPLREI